MKITNQTSTQPQIAGAELSPNDLIGVSHALNGKAPFEYESFSITFKELCDGIARQMKRNGDLPLNDD